MNSIGPHPHPSPLPRLQPVTTPGERREKSWYLVMLRPMVLLVLIYAVAICFERIIEVEIYKPYLIVGALLIVCALASGRLVVDGIARAALLYLFIGVAIGMVHLIAVPAQMSGLVGDSLLWLFNIATFIAICTLLRTRREVALVLIAHAVVMIFASYDILTNSAEMFEIEGAQLRVSGDFKNPANACLAMMTASLVMLTMLRKAFARGDILLRKALVIGFGAALLVFELYVSSLTGSRSGALLFVVGVMAYLLVIGRRRVALLLAIASIAAAIGLVVVDAQPQKETENILLQRSESKGLDTDRWYLWRSGMDAYVDSYGIGVGIAQYRRLHREYYDQYAMRGDVRLAEKDLSLHSDYMTALVEFGALGVLVFILLCRRIWRLATSIVSTDARAIAIALVCACAINGFVHAVLPYFGLWFYLALMACWARFERSDGLLPAKPS